ncbi:hypothetical protein C0J52_15156 [Blattella germanica]|nr:hypothetical protein C0J52_15156 [Blattella germanica]
MCKEGHEKLGDKISKAHARSSGNSAPRKKVGSPSASGSLSPDMESLRNEQYAALKFCVRLQKSSTEAYALLKQAYGEDVLPQSTAFRWLKQFKEGRGLPGNLLPLGMLSPAILGNLSSFILETCSFQSRFLFSTDPQSSVGSCKYL